MKYSQVKALIYTILSALATIAFCYILYLQPNVYEGITSLTYILLGSVCAAITIINAFNFSKKLRHPDEIL